MIAKPISSGIDLGGTKIEAQVFAADWSLQARNRWPTPKDYPALVQAMAEAIRWCETHGPVPIGISAAGLINPATGLALTSNLSATGKPFPADIARAANRKIAWINDCRALTLSEATLGAAKGADPAVGLILGTGVAGGVVTGGHLLPSPAQTGGEFGHFPLAAAPIAAHNLPILTCGCGREGCVETYLSAPGLSRVAAHLTGTQHALANVLVEPGEEPGTARVRASVRADHALTVDGATRVFTLVGYYDDRCRSTMDGWVITTKRLVVEWTSGDPSVMDEARARAADGRVR